MIGVIYTTYLHLIIPFNYRTNQTISVIFNVKINNIIYLSSTKKQHRSTSSITIISPILHPRIVIFKTHYESSNGSPISSKHMNTSKFLERLVSWVIMMLRVKRVKNYNQVKLNWNRGHWKSPASPAWWGFYNSGQISNDHPLQRVKHYPFSSHDVEIHIHIY